MPARDFSQYEGSTHINLIEQLKDLSLAGNNSSPHSPQEVYGNGTAGGVHEDTDLLEGTICFLLHLPKEFAALGCVHLGCHRCYENRYNVQCMHKLGDA